MCGAGMMEYGHGEAEYSGEWAQGLRNGQGTLVRSAGVTPDCGKLEGLVRYTGTWQAGRMTGQGEATYSNGDVYTGAFVDGRRHGAGVVQCGNGDTFTGDFRQDVKHGVGKLVPAAGGGYSGPWEGGAMSVPAGAWEAGQAAREGDSKAQ